MGLSLKVKSSDLKRGIWCFGTKSSRFQTTDNIAKLHGARIFLRYGEMVKLRYMYFLISLVKIAV